jgi:UDP:flavonoid glycosyltransferase YjiC (YdhE family)
LTANLIVAADKELAPLPPEAPADCWQTGYWHPPPKKALPAPILRFLRDGPAPIYIGFGSMGDPTPQQTIAILRRAVHLAGVRAIFQSGWAGWDFQSDADCLCATGDLPHENLFTRVAGVVHHGGAGTVMAAARAGVPQMIVPHLLDQYYWGRRIMKLGIGPPPIRKNRLTAEALAQALSRMVTSRAMRVRAQELSAPLQRRNGARQAADWILAGRTG